MTVAALAAAIRRGELSPREAVQAALDRIEREDGAYNSFLTVRGEESLAEADALGAPSGPLHGVPLAVKDVIDVAGTRTTAASKVLADNVATADAIVVARLRRAGAIIVGKLNTHEFAFGASTTSAAFGPARNPWDTERICGGSSGGSGAAVAAGLVPGTLGTDTAGSIRIPAAFCGVTGIRPSTGRVPNRGVVPVSWTYDTVGPLARTAEDCALLLDAIAGPDPDDASTTPVAREPCLDALELGVEGLRIGVVSHLMGGEVPLDPRVAAAVETALVVLEDLGAHVERVDAAFLRRAEVVQQLVMLPEAAEAHLPWLRTKLADYGADVRARLLAGLLLPVLRADHRPARPAGARGGGAPALRALRPPRGARDAARRAADRRGPCRGRRARARLPALADPLQLALELPRRPHRERPVRLRRRAPGRPRAHRPPARRSHRPRVPRTPTSRSPTGMSVGRPSPA